MEEIDKYGRTQQSKKETKMEGEATLPKGIGNTQRSQPVLCGLFFLFSTFFKVKFFEKVSWEFLKLPFRLSLSDDPGFLWEGKSLGFFEWVDWASGVSDDSRQRIPQDFFGFSWDEKQEIELRCPDSSDCLLWARVSIFDDPDSRPNEGVCWTEKQGVWVLHKNQSFLSADEKETSFGGRSAESHSQGQQLLQKEEARSQIRLLLEGPGEKRKETAETVDSPEDNVQASSASHERNQQASFLSDQRNQQWFSFEPNPNKPLDQKELWEFYCHGELVEWPPGGELPWATEHVFAPKKEHPRLQT